MIASTLRTCCVLLGFTFLFVPTSFSADYSSAVTAKVLTKTSLDASGQKISYPATDKAEVTAMTVELPPGSETGWHKHPVPVYAYVVAGNLTVTLEDGRELVYKAGDAVIEVVNVSHNGRNRGNETVKLAVFYLGIEGAPTVIKDDPRGKTKPLKAPAPGPTP